MSTELAWAAGFFDGEGCTYYEGRRSIRLSVVQTQADGELPVTLVRFKDAVGGFGYFNRRPTRDDWSPSWSWSLGKRDEARAVLVALWPYLSQPKKDQAERVLAKADAYECKPRGKGPPLREHCKRGHLMAETRRRPPRGGTYCAECVRLRSLEHQQRQKVGI